MWRTKIWGCRGKRKMVRAEGAELALQGSSNVRRRRR